MTQELEPGKIYTILKNKGKLTNCFYIGIRKKKEVMNKHLFGHVYENPDGYKGAKLIATDDFSLNGNNEIRIQKYVSIRLPKYGSDYLKQRLEELLKNA